MTDGLTLDLKPDHLVVKLDPKGVVQAIATSFIVPYSTIADASVQRPSIPGTFDNWLHGLHVPTRVARGRFIDWKRKRRFLWIDHKTERAIVLRLQGHPAYDECVLDVPDAEGALAFIERQRKATGATWGHVRE